MATQTMNTIQAVNLALHDAMKADDTLLVLGEDVADREEGGVVGATKGLSTAFGDDRVKSTPISEQAIIGSAIGAAMCGHRVVAEIMLMNFTTVAMDMIVNHAAKLRFMSGGQTHVPITIRMMTGAGFSNGGQHSDYLEAWFAHTAGIKVVAPSSPNSAYALLRSAIEDPDPVIFIENLPTYFAPGSVTPEKFPLGKAFVEREGTDVTIISYAAIMTNVRAAVEQLEAQGVSVELIDLRTISPWDKETVLASVAKTGRALIVHEAVREFGVGAEIGMHISEHLFGRLKAPVRRLGGAFCPVPYSKPLETAFVPQKDDIVSTVTTML
ncbi:alpha-ketoacid dehydrogenase subunit beta [Novosphingobium sp. 9U]|uniref:alpha-ketoacid dehydrogenase subunit beta n=1 Tax=Novosphingobium sp. 9U TaxID=2653158 RepID=UPI0012F140A7|nr:alpha-ketoacid dehydrogenase subunit beta [Novosphingobium sp. 9U]VWX50196.1 3-methyl-2-oxobutanoate dehydrogenase subunit beta [Novosphingobium sp. 9U]